MWKRLISHHCVAINFGYIPFVLKIYRLQFFAIIVVHLHQHLHHHEARVPAETEPHVRTKQPGHQTKEGVGHEQCHHRGEQDFDAPVAGFLSVLLENHNHRHGRQQADAELDETANLLGLGGNGNGVENQKTKFCQDEDCHRRAVFFGNHRGLVLML